MTVNRGRLVALEGIDGCGKSAQAAPLLDALSAGGHAVVATREPTDGPTGRRIRERARAGERESAADELEAFLADRREHVDALIEPALAAGSWVITDRYFLSTVAYQGACGLDWRAILARCEAIFPVPDVALLFDLPVQEALARTRARGGGATAFERADYLERVQAIFASIDRPYVVRVDASGPIEQVTGRALVALRERLDD